MFARTVLGALLAVAVLSPAVLAVINTDGTFQEDVLCELREGLLGKQCDAEGCPSQKNCKCCPLTVPNYAIKPELGRRSRKACSDYISKNNNGECGFILNKDNMSAKVGEFPYFVALGYRFKDNDTEDKWNCGGGLISEKFVLTSATCLKGGPKGPSVVLLGSVDPEKDGTTPGPHTQRIAVAEVFVHPEYSMKKNDIGIIRLAEAARISDAVRPACLFTSPQPPLARATLAGFGVTSPRGDGGINLNKVNKVDLPIIAKEKCNSTALRLGDGLDDSTMICAGEKGKDSCTGDSGAPLVVKSALHCSYQILGITSFGRVPCGSDVPSIYAKVYSYLPWIESIVWSK